MADYSVHTLTELHTMMEDRWDGTPFWTDDEATIAINEALRMWNALTGYWKATDTLETQINAWEYPLPASMVFGLRVEYEGHPLAQSSLHEMNSARPGWQAQTTASGGSVPTAPRVWLPLSVDLIAIWPADAVGDHTLTLDGVSATPSLSAGGDYIDVGEPILGVILGYALHVAAFKEGGQRFEATMPYFSDFLTAAAEENSQLKASAMFRSFTGLDMQRFEQPTMGIPTNYAKLVGK